MEFPKLNCLKIFEIKILKKIYIERRLENYKKINK